MKNKLILFITLVFMGISVFSQTTEKKRALTQKDYDSWKVLRNTQISNDGRWISYEVNPQKGDGMLYIYNREYQRYDSVARGYNAKFSADSKFMVFKIKPQQDTVLKAKLAKLKKEKMPKDSLGIYVLEKNDLTKIARVKSYRLPEKGSEWVAYLMEKPLAAKDTTATTDTITIKPKKKKNKGKGSRLVMEKVIEGKTFNFEDVTDYTVAESGSLFAFVRQVNDSVDSTFVVCFSPKKESHRTVFQNEGSAKKVATDRSGHQLAFVFSADTAKEKNYNLMYWRQKAKTATMVVDSLTTGMISGWCVSEYRTPSFSENGERLFFGTAPAVETQPKDTLPEDEKPHVDIWNWKDPLLQPQQKKQLENERKRSYLAVYYPGKNRMVQIADKEVPEVRTFGKGNTETALGYSDLPYRQLISWDDTYRDYYAVDLTSGTKKLLLRKKQSYAGLSPRGKYILWYETADSSWYAENVETGKTISLTKDIPVNFYYELNDVPQLPGNYGVAGWTQKDGHVLIYDKYDIWKLDPEGKEPPKNLTAGYGRKNEIRFRYLKLDKEQEYTEEEMTLSGFNFRDKSGGYYRIALKQGGAPKLLISGDVRFSGLKKAKEASVVIWQKQAFNLYPDLWWSNTGFQAPVQVTHLDRQRDPFLWGNVQLVHWISDDGDSLTGLFYTPENLDPAKKYPLLVYFYERSSDGLHRFRHPSPSRSIINPSYCVSNDYLVFVPDIPYTVGYPGQSAYKAVVSGTLAMLDRFPFIDRQNMGLQGQSWGGYQVAFLVTRTNLYKAAMAGAPVSNMTSAYGGIRWGSGMSRMFQYEKTQSRIGGTLWEKPLRYIENSPVFYADKVETPLLIMHNDNDGAVPWYQGIEFFVALRRLHKPAWMLTYNNEEHNLTKWPDRMDLDIRMYQFFDHYLKNAPEPHWMKYGIPAIEKGINKGYSPDGQ